MARRSTEATKAAPKLPELTFTAGCTRIAVIGLHGGAGARTVVESIAAELHRRGVRTGVTRAPRLPTEVDDRGPDDAARIGLPEGTIVATARGLAEGRDDLEPIDGRPDGAADVGLFRLTRPTELPVYGPDDPEAMSEVMTRLDEASGGMALVDGAWEHRAFAAPEIAEGVILVVGSGYSGSPERSAAALGFVAETLAVPRCDDALCDAWASAVEEDFALALDAQAQVIERLRPEQTNPVPRLERLGDRVQSVVFPGKVHDRLLSTLVRSTFRCTLVVKDPTRIQVAPIYFKAWQKGGGAFRVVDSMRLLAVATNPVNAQGPDAEPDQFRRLVTETLPGVPVHDVRLEAEGAERKPVWKFWA